MPLIQFTNVSLEYPVRENRALTLSGLFRSRVLGRPEAPMKTVKALNDLSFEIHEGERVGIIGFNGAGKSTLLKTIAGIYPIESGKRVVEGKISSLFDINIGFEPDATGWQNIYYRGYLQGETPATIKKVRQDIADFTELGNYLDLPIRCYSTGMAMRLSFAIATARSPEILLVDEVLGTGDIVFQEKATARMKKFMGHARMAVMVSHYLPFLERHCTTIYWLHNGALRAKGPPSEMIRAFKEEAERMRGDEADRLRAAA